MHQTLNDDYWDRRDHSSVWRFAAKLTIGMLYPHISWLDGQVVHEYIIKKLGREGADTLLGEIMLLPAKNMAHWPFGAV